MKRKIPIIIITVLAVVLVLAGVGGKFGYDWWNSTYIKINDETVRRDITVLDLHGQPLPPLDRLTQLKQLETLDLTDTGLTADQYDQLCLELPQCSILWTVPFQGSYLDMNSTQITVTQLSLDDIAQLKYFRKLTAVDATECTDYEVIQRLLTDRSDLSVSYCVAVNSQKFPHDTTEMTLENANAAEVSVALEYLPALTKVTFTGVAPDNDQILDWKTTYPQITFVWTFDVFGVSATSLDTELILNNTPLRSVEAVEAYFPYFYNLQKVELCNCGLLSADLDALWKRHPETRIIWNVMVGKCELRTDVTTFMPWHFGYKDGSQIKDADTAELKYCVDIICMDIGHMAISDYSFLEYMPNMQYLIIADTDGTDFSALASLKELKYLEVFMTRFNQAEVLTGLTKLEDLNIGTSQISNIEPLKEMTWLKNLWLPACVKLSAQSRRELVEALPDTNIMYLGAGSTGNGWRKLPNYFEMRDLLEVPYTSGW